MPGQYLLNAPQFQNQPVDGVLHVPHGRRSVSYTHLDVYKRQGNLFRFALGHSIAMTLFICVLTYLQATVWQWMLP